VLNVQYVTIGLAFILLIFITYLTWKRKLENKTSFLWLIISIGGVVIALLLPTFDRLSQSLGIVHFPTLLFAGLFIFVIILLVYKSIAIHHLNNQVKELTQTTTLELQYIKDELHRNRKESNE